MSPKFSEPLTSKLFTVEEPETKISVALIPPKTSKV